MTCASAPARGGSSTMISKPLSSCSSSGRRNRSRVSVAMGLSPCVAPAPLASASIAALSLSTASTCIFSAMRKLNGPQPAKRSAARLPLGSAAMTSPASTSSPAAVACRKPPAAGATSALPMCCKGGRRSTTISPWFESRARSSRSANCVSASRSLSPSGPWPRISTSSPASEAVTWISSGLLAPPIRFASIRATAGARSSPGASTGQASTEIRSWLRAAMKPTTIASPWRRAWKVTRRRPAPWASTRSATGASMPARLSAVTTCCRFHSR